MPQRGDHWIGNARRDGLFVAESLDGWAIFGGGGGFLNHCPCCRLPLTTAEIAKKVADRTVPLERDESKRPQ